MRAGSNLLLPLDRGTCFVHIAKIVEGKPQEPLKQVSLWRGGVHRETDAFSRSHTDYLALLILQHRAAEQAH